MGGAQSKANKEKTEEEEENIVEVVKFPYNYESILREADSSFIDTSSTDDYKQLYDQLCNGVFLNQKKKKYWVEKKSNRNCFFLFARDLLITWADDNRFWQWPCVYESRNLMVDVGELVNVCWLEIHGNFDTGKLTPNTLYEAAYVIMLKDHAYGWEFPVSFRIILPNGTSQLHKENLAAKSRGEWIEIAAGEFLTSQENVGLMEISMYDYDGGNWKSGLVVKGITIRPKNYVHNIDP